MLQLDRQTPAGVFRETNRTFVSVATKLWANAIEDTEFQVKALKKKNCNSLFDFTPNTPQIFLPENFHDILL